MPLSLNPHEFSAHPETGAPVLVRIQPYIRVSEGRNPPLFLQSGQVFTEGDGGVVHPEEYPPWLIDAIRRLKKHALAEVGFDKFVQNLNAQRKLDPAGTEKK